MSIEIKCQRKSAFLNNMKMHNVLDNKFLIRYISF